MSFDPAAVTRAPVRYNYALRPFPYEEAPGIGVFARDETGAVYHTYSTYGRGVEVAMGTYHLLDLVPSGRDESKLDYGMEWVRHHDRYRHARRRSWLAPAAARGAGVVRRTEVLVVCLGVGGTRCVVGRPGVVRRGGSGALDLRPARPRRRGRVVQLASAAAGCGLKPSRARSLRLPPVDFIAG